MLSQTYDSSANALYIQLSNVAVARTEEIDPLTLVDVDEGGSIVGIEVLHPARDWPVSEIIERFNIDGEDRKLLEVMYPRLETRHGLFGFVAPEQEVVSGNTLAVA